MSLAKSVGGSTIISAVGTVSSYALTILLARDGGAAAYGGYALCLAWAAILTVLIDCASDAAFSHLSIQRSDPQTAFNIVSTLRISIFVGLLALLIGARVTGIADVPWQTLIFMLPAFNLGILFEYYRSNVRFAAIICGEKIALLAANVALLSLVDFEVAVYIAYAVVSVGSLAIQALAYRRHVTNLRPAAISAIWAYAAAYWPLFLIALSQLGYGHLSRLVIEAKQGVIIFAAVSLAFQIVALASILQSQVDRSFRPPIIEAVRTNDRGQLRRLVGHYLLFATAPMAAGAAVVFAVAPWLIHLLFGAEYKLAGDVLRDISPLFVSISLMRLTDLILLALDLIKHSLAINLGVSLLMLAILMSLPASKPLAMLTAIIVGAQYIQAAISSVLVLRTLRRRFA